MTFSDLRIIKPILEALEKKEYFKPTTIQMQSIPILLEGRDILGSAQTGTGKTAAFAIPILQNLHLENQTQKGSRKVKALVVAPTRELAIQIYDNFIEYSKNLGIRTAVIYGGVSQGKQVNAIRNGVDVLVATPGRLLDLVNQKLLSLKDVSYLVLDEADTMLDMGFVRDVRKIVSLVKKQRQTMLFSATMPKAIATLAQEILTDPVRVEVAPVENTADKIVQSLYFVEHKKKVKLLVDLLKDSSLKSVLVFSRTKHGANRIVKQLDVQGVEAVAIHGNKSQSARQKALSMFKKKMVRVLVATDIAARGIDVDDLTHVFNFDLPDVPETYIHRIGRTGRAGQSGVAISFCSPEEATQLKDIEKHLKKKIEVLVHGSHSIELTDALIASRKKSAAKKKSNKNNAPKVNKRSANAQRPKSKPKSKDARNAERRRNAEKRSHTPSNRSESTSNSSGVKRKNSGKKSGAARKREMKKLSESKQVNHNFAKFDKRNRRK